MTNIPEELKYSETHEWVRIGTDGHTTVGITDHAQELLGDIVFVELPDIGMQIHNGNDCCVVESVKAAADIVAPLSGTLIAVNQALDEEPELINSDPYGEGWVFRIKLNDPDELHDLLDHEAYAELVESEGESDSHHEREDEE